MILLILTLGGVAKEAKLRFWTNYVCPLFNRLFYYVHLLSAVRNERHALSNLTDDELFDIGLSRLDAQRECQRSYWDVPEDRQLDFDRSANIESQAKE